MTITVMMITLMTITVMMVTVMSMMITVMRMARMSPQGGGSEMLQNPISGAVVSSLCFHPSEHLLVFSTMHRIYFWDWDKPQPFATASTLTFQERVRYCD